MNVLCSEVDAESNNVIDMIQSYTIHEILSKMCIILHFPPLSVNTTVRDEEMELGAIND